MKDWIRDEEWMKTFREYKRERCCECLYELAKKRELTNDDLERKVIDIKMERQWKEMNRYGVA